MAFFVFGLWTGNESVLELGIVNLASALPRAFLDLPSFAEGTQLFRPRMLFDNCIGRKRDVGGGFLAGTCRGSGLRRELGCWIGDGNRRDADGHVSKFIALGLFDSYERRETVARV